MTTAVYTYNEDIVSDLHKDAYGFRPCQNWWADWGSMNPVGKQQEWDGLIRVMNTRMERETQMEQEAVVRVEASVAVTIAAGAGDRATAIKWLMDAEERVNGDVNYFEFLQGIPYGYVALK